MPLEPWQLDFAEAVAKQRQDGWGWRWGDMESWPTEKIFEQLHQLGIDTDAARFHQQAMAAGGFKVLREDWDAQLAAAGMDKEFWPDFPLISVRILWQRLAPDVICPDLIELDLYKVVSSEEEKTPLKDADGIPANVAAVQRLAHYLQRFAPADRAARYDEIIGDGMYDYTDWLTDFIFNRGADWPDIAIQIADVLAARTHGDHIPFDLAMALAQAGRRDEALSRTNAALEDFPDDEWAKILAADVYEKLGDDAGAIRLWFQALEMVDSPMDWDAVVDRLKDAIKRTGREKELDDIIRAHPRQVQPARPIANTRTAPRDPPVLDAARRDRLTQATKIGRNEPCPCGSGKKYKKCCMP